MDGRDKPGQDEVKSRCVRHRAQGGSGRRTAYVNIG